MTSSEAVVKLKDEGNQAFAQQKLVEALTCYTKALTLLGSSALSDNDLAATLFSNRAMVRLQQKEHDACIQDCTQALALDPGRTKALYRRAQSYEALGREADALRDLHRLLQLEPNNRAAVTAAQRVKDRVSRLASEESPPRQALKKIRDESATRADRLPAVRALGGMAAGDPSVAMQVLRDNGIQTLQELWASPEASGEDGGALATEALRAVGACCQHQIVGPELLAGACSGSGPLWVEDVTERGVRAEGPGVATAALSMLVHLYKWDDAVLLALTEAQEQAQAAAGGESSGGGAVDPSQLLGAAEPFNVPAVGAWSAGLAHADLQVRETALSALAMWCADKTDASEDAQIPPSSTSTPDERQRLHRRRTKRNLMARDRAMAVFGDREAFLPLYKLGGSEQASERRKAGGAVGRLIRCVAGAVTGEKERQATAQQLKDALSPFLHYTCGVSSSAEDQGETPAPPDPRESRLQGMLRRVNLATAIAGADAEFGGWAMGLNGWVAEVMMLAAMGDTMSQEVAAEAICAASSIDGGRGYLAPVVESGVIFALMESGHPATKSAAASGYAKLGMLSQALKGSSDDVTRLLNVALQLLGHDGASQADKERAVEVLSFLVSKTQVKEELVYGSNRCKPSLDKLCQAARGIEGDHPMAYGLAFIFSALTISVEEQKREALKDKDISYEQYEQLQKMAQNAGQQAPPDDEGDEDSFDAANRRSAKLVAAGVVPALKKLLEGASLKTKEAVAACFRHLATEAGSRGALVQQGALSTLVNMSVDTSASQKGRADAVHAIAKTLVTTNPNMLTHAHRLGCIPPLMALCRSNDSSDLQQFESLMALTNLASTGQDAQDRIMADRGVGALAYCQFSDNLMVRRAATEAMLNLMPHPKMILHLRNPEHMKLWVAFSLLYQGEQEDLPTATAAAATLAMGVQDQEVAEVLMKAKGPEALIELLHSDNPDLVHRAAAAVAGLAEHESTKGPLRQTGVAKVLDEIAELGDQGSPVVQAARGALMALGGQ